MEAALSVLHRGGWVALAVLAAWVGHSQPSHRGVAAYATWMAVCDTVRPFLREVLAGAARPLAGGPRLAFHIEELLVLSWSFLFLACCVRYFLARRTWPIVGAWLLAWVVCLDYPRISGPSLAALYKIVGTGSMLVAWALIAWTMFARRAVPRLAHLTLMAFAVGDLTIALVAYAGDLNQRWPLVRLASVCMLAAACGFHIVWLVRRRSGELAW